MDDSLKYGDYQIPKGHESILTALYNHHEATALHSLTVAAYTKEFLESIGENKTDVKKGFLAALVHDAGKLAVPSELLNKKGILTEEEKALISNHTSGARAYLDGTIKESELGDEISIEGIDVFDIHVAESHHLPSEQIPYLTRCIEICDVYAALTENRMYRDPASMREALHTMYTDDRQSYLDKTLLNKFASFINSLEVDKERTIIKSQLINLGVDLSEPGVYLIQNQDTKKVVDINGFKMFPGYWYGIDTETNELVCTTGKEYNNNLKVYRTSEYIYGWQKSWESENDLDIKALNFKAPEIDTKFDLDTYIDYFIGEEANLISPDVIEQAYFDYVNDNLPYFVREQLENASFDAISNEDLILAYKEVRSKFVEGKTSEMSFEDKYNFVTNDFIEEYEDEFEEETEIAG